MDFIGLAFEIPPSTTMMLAEEGDVSSAYLVLALVEAWRTSISAGVWPVVAIVVWSDFLRNKTDRKLKVMTLSQTYPEIPDPIKNLLSQQM